VKQLHTRLDETDERLWSNPVYPYSIVSVEQVSPSREVLEVFEGRRNELDKTLRGAKLETIQGFYCPSSYDVLNKIVKDGFYQTFSGEITFSVDAPQAIQESLSSQPINKLILARISLGSKDRDYTEIHHKYKIRNLRGVIPAFIITFQYVGEGQAPIPYTPPPTSNYVELDLTINRNNQTTTTTSSYEPETTYSPPPPDPNVRLPKYMRDLERNLG